MSNNRINSDLLECGFKEPEYKEIDRTTKAKNPKAEVENKKS